MKQFRTYFFSILAVVAIMSGAGLVNARINNPTGSGGSGGTAIGSPVTGGTAGSVLFVDGSGNLGQDNTNFNYDGTGHQLSIGCSPAQAKLQVCDTSSVTFRGILDDEYINTTNGSKIDLRKARGTPSAPLVLVSGDTLGGVNYAGYDGTNFIESARVLATSTGTVSTGIIPSILQLQTTNSIGTLATGLQIDSSQNIEIPQFVNIGSTATPTSQLQVTGNVSAPSWTTNGISFNNVANTYTDTTATGTVSVEAINSFQTPSLASSAVATFTNAATLYIDNAPTAGSNATITNAWSIYAAAGRAGLLGGIGTSNGTISNGNFTVNAGAAIGPGSTNTGLIPTNTGGAITTIQSRSSLYGSSMTTLSSNTSFGSTIFGAAGVTTSGTGTHTLLANIIVRPLSVATGASTLTNTATVYIDGADTHGTNNYAFWSASGTNRFDGGILGNAGFAGNIRTVTTNTTLTAGSDFTILCNATGGNVTITVPVTTKWIYNVKKIDSSANTCTIAPATGTIDGSATKVESTQYTNVQFQADGTNLNIL